MSTWICFSVTGSTLAPYFRASGISTMADPSGVRGGWGDRGEGRGGDDGSGGGRSEERDGSQDPGLNHCPACGKDTASTTDLYTHVRIHGCLATLGQSFEQFRQKHRLRGEKARYRRQEVERRAKRRQKVSVSVHSWFLYANEMGARSPLVSVSVHSWILYS